MNRIVENIQNSTLSQFESLSSCSIHKKNQIQGVFVGEECPSHLNRLQCFKCVLKSKDLQCISVQHILQYQQKQTHIGTLKQSVIAHSDDIQNLSQEEDDESSDSEEYTAFWPPFNNELKCRIKEIANKLNMNAMEDIISTFDQIKQQFNETIEQIKKESLLIAQTVLEDYMNLIDYYEEKKQLEDIKNIIISNSSDADLTNSELEKFITESYKNQSANNMELTKKIAQINQNLPYISEETFQSFNQELERLLNSFRMQQSKKMMGIKFIKSTYEKSSYINIVEDDLGFQTMSADFEGRGQLYSNCTFENSEKYELIFEFDRPPKECIIIGLTEDDNKDLNWYDRSNFYAIQLGKQSNDSFSEKILKGKNIKQLFTSNSQLSMQFHIAKNKLYFSDYPNYENVNALDPNQYSFDQNLKYRIIIYFRNQIGLKITLKKAYEIYDLVSV